MRQVFLDFHYIHDHPNTPWRTATAASPPLRQNYHYKRCRGSLRGKIVSGSDTPGTSVNLLGTTICQAFWGLLASAGHGFRCQVEIVAERSGFASTRDAPH